MGTQLVESWTKTQLAVFFAVLLLAVDEVNPVKLFLHVFPAVSPWHVALSCIVVMTYIFVSDLKDLLYFTTKVFFHSILSIFFRDVEVIGKENIPPYGPVLFTVNHANQFIDAVMVVCTCKHKVSYLMAEASWKRRIIGDIAWALGVVPVKRAQDEAQTGTGQLQYGTPRPSRSSASEVVPAEDGEDPAMEIEVTGVNTKFAQELQVGDKVRPFGTAYSVKVTQIVGSDRIVVDATGLPKDFPFPARGESVSYDILRHIPLNVVFGKVLEKLAAGGAVGIFPEGGSHDRTDLLPLKVGVALIAYSALEKDGINVPIVPVGLNYFRAHRWRGRAVVEYGRPITIEPSTLKSFKAGGAKRRQVCNDLLEDIESSMRSVIVSTTDYDTLEIIHTARRLYRREKGPMDTSEKQELSRRFAEGYRRLLLMTDGKPPPEWLDLQRRLIEYRNEIKDLGLKDYQVPGLSGEHLDESLNVNKVDGDSVLSVLHLVYNIVHLLLLLVLAAVPVVLLNLPVGLLAGIYAESRRKTALAKSKVKIRGFDVMLTEKVVFCLVTVPTLWVVYGLVLLFMTNLDRPTIALIMMTMPIFAYVGIVVTEAGMVEVKDLRPYFMRLFPSARKRLSQLPQTRKTLQDDLRAFIKSIGPALGEVYYAKEPIDWKMIRDKSFRVDNKGDDKKSA